MVVSGVPFWTAVKQPYLRRLLNRDQLWPWSTEASRRRADVPGSTPALQPSDSDYPRFIAFLNRNKP